MGAVPTYPGCEPITCAQPSGLNRWWNDPANQAAAGAFLRGLVDEVRTAKGLADSRTAPTPGVSP